MSDRLDIVLIGAGLIGPALALALDRQGFRVAMLDPVAARTRAAPDFDGRAYAIAPGSANLLKGLDVWPEASPIRAIHVEDACADPAPPAQLHFDPAEIGAAQTGWMIEDRHLRRALLDAVAEAGIDHRAPCHAVSVDYTPTGAHVTLDSGESLVADLIVACDGRQSATARSAGIGYLSWSYGQTGQVCAIAHTNDHEGSAHQRFFPGGPFAVLPLAGRRSALVWSERDDQAARIAALDDSAYTAEIAARIQGRLGEIALEGRRWTYPLGLSLADRYVAPRLALAGDAAHGVHPIAGQGLNMGLRDVAALTEVLVDACRLGEDIGALPVLERYQQWRRFDSSAMALGMDGLNRLFSTGAPLAQLMRNAGLGSIARSGGARRFFLRAAAGVAGDVPRLLAGQPI